MKIIEKPHTILLPDVWLLTFWEMGVEGGLDLSQYVSVVFSYLLNFCKLWHLCKFRILGELFTHLFGLVFPCPTSDKMSGLPLRSIKVVFFKFFFFKKIVKNVAQALFIYVCVYKPPQAPFRQLGENLNKFDKLCIFPYIYFMLKDYQEPHVGTRYRRNLILRFIIYNNQWL